MIQKHCFECGAELTEQELDGEGIVPYCPKCKQETLINAYKLNISVIKEPDAQTQSR